MTWFHPAWLDHQRWRWMLPDPSRFVVPQLERKFRSALRSAAASQDRQGASASRDAAVIKHGLAGLRSELALMRRALLGRKANFNPDQPRVPAGNPDGGQWTDGGGGSASSDFSGASRNRGSATVRIGGRSVPVEPGQAARLAIAQANAQNAIARVRALDPNWRPSPSAYESVEGLIGAYEADAQQAETRLAELSRVGIGPGPFAGESIPARGPERDFTAEERAEINRIGAEMGCHTCGYLSSGTGSGNFVPDHQPPNALNFSGGPQRLYPQCLTCSRMQGGAVRKR